MFGGLRYGQLRLVAVGSMSNSALLIFHVGRFVKHGRRGRVSVLLDLLGKAVPVELDEKIVSPV